MKAVIAAAQGVAGVGPGDVTTGSISVRRVVKGQRPVYRASEGVSVLTHQPEAAGELVAAGVAVGATGTRGPNFFVGDREAAYNAALVEALEKAKTKAGMLAAAAGATLGPALTITEGGAVTPVNQTAAAAEPVSKCVAATPQGSTGVSRRGPHASVCATPPPVKPGKSTVEATVDATFGLQ